jgi:hypothetical protein
LFTPQRYDAAEAAASTPLNAFSVMEADFALLHLQDRITAVVGQLLCLYPEKYRKEGRKRKY